MRTPEQVETRILRGLQVEKAATGQTFTWYEADGTSGLYSDNPEVQRKLAAAIRSKQSIVATVTPPSQVGEQKITGVIATGRSKKSP